MKTSVKSRSRRPQLRVVGHEPIARPPRTTMLIGDVPHIVELWSLALVAATPEWARPSEGSYLPGFGYLIPRLPYDDQELEDLYAEIDSDFAERFPGLAEG